MQKIVAHRHPAQGFIFLIPTEMKGIQIIYRLY